MCNVYIYILFVAYVFPKCFNLAVTYSSLFPRLNTVHCTYYPLPLPSISQLSHGLVFVHPSPPPSLHLLHTLVPPSSLTSSLSDFISLSLPPLLPSLPLSLSSSLPLSLPFLPPSPPSLPYPLTSSSLLQHCLQQRR